jgi:hypothetical protein
MRESEMREAEMRLPCGCETWLRGGVFFFAPHDIKCPYYRYVLEEAKRQGKDMMVRLGEE